MKYKLLSALLATSLSFAAAQALAANAPKTLSAKKTEHHMMHKHHAVHRETMKKCSPKETQALQQALRDSGFYKGTVTGKWDDATRNAIASYQNANGLPVTGDLDSRTYKALGLHPIAKEKEERGTKSMAHHTHKKWHHHAKTMKKETKK